MNSINNKEAARKFHRSFLILVAIAWTVPAGIGFSFFPIFEIYNGEQILNIILTPLILGYMLGVFAFVLFYFHIYIKPVTQWIEKPDPKNEDFVQHRLKSFYIHFWVLFMAYDLAGGTVTMISGEIYNIHSLAPIEIFRVYMIAVIAAIIPGLPIFFKLYDLFGSALGNCLRLRQPLLTIKTRVFLIGALIPFLIDSILVQYFWTRTGYFGWDTFAIWIILEVLAIVGTLFFLRGFSQSLSPLNSLLISTNGNLKSTQVIPASTDELGFISAKLGDLLNNIEKNKRDMQGIMDFTPAAIYIKDLEGRYIFINQKVESLLHLNSAEIIGKTDYDIFPHGLAKTISANDKAVIDAGHALESEETVALQDGERSYISVRFPLVNNDESIYAVCGISTDITDRIAMEEILRRSQKMDAIGQLSGGIAHDFNNQLGIIIGYLDILKEHVSEQEQPRKYVDTAAQATLRCIDLTRQLLTFSRKQLKNKSVVNINTSIENLQTMIKRSITPEVEVEMSLDEDLWSTEIDPGELQDAILNLSINARDAMPDGGKLIIETCNSTIDEDFITLNPGVKVGDYVRLSFSDNGMGMNKSTLEHIFEPFFTTKAEGKGTGLGMAMVYGFIKQYEGYIKIYSELNIGTSMHLYLPRSHASESSDINLHNTETVLPRGSESILLVDDESDLLTLADKYLSELGYKTQIAENAKQALQILSTDQHFDLLFSDVIMPGGINGYELAQLAIKQRPQIKVQLASGFTTKTIAQDGPAYLSEQLLHKPYRRAELAHRVRAILDETIS